jgi:CheY-like chemotaxis protein
VSSGTEALTRLRHERFDAMTLDVSMPVMNCFDVLEAVRGDSRLRDLPIIFVSVSSTLPQLAGEWAVGKPIDRRRLTDVLTSAIHANRTRVLVVAPDRLRDALEPSLSALSVEHRWESTPLDAARAGAEELFEVALVHASMSTSRSLLDGDALRGRRRGRSVILFSTDGEGYATGGGMGMPVFPLTQAVTALRSALGERGTAGGR